MKGKDEEIVEKRSATGYEPGNHKDSGNPLSRKQLEAGRASGCNYHTCLCATQLLLFLRISLQQGSSARWTLDLNL